MTRTTLRAHGWFHVITGEWSEQPPSYRSDDWKRATIWTDEQQKQTKTVYQWRYRKANGAWTVAKNLYTEEEASEWGVKHAGPFEVPI